MIIEDIPMEQRRLRLMLMDVIGKKDILKLQDIMPSL